MTLEQGPDAGKKRLEITEVQILVCRSGLRCSPSNRAGNLSRYRGEDQGKNALLLHQTKKSSNKTETRHQSSGEKGE